MKEDAGQDIVSDIFQFLAEIDRLAVDLPCSTTWCCRRSTDAEGRGRSPQLCPKGRLLAYLCLPIE